MNTTRKRNKML